MEKLQIAVFDSERYILRTTVTTRKWVGWELQENLAINPWHTVYDEETGPAEIVQSYHSKDHIIHVHRAATTERS